MATKPTPKRLIIEIDQDFHHAIKTLALQEGNTTIREWFLLLLSSTYPQFEEKVAAELEYGINSDTAPIIDIPLDKA